MQYLIIVIDHVVIKFKLRKLTLIRQMVYSLLSLDQRVLFKSGT